MTSVGPRHLTELLDEGERALLADLLDGLVPGCDGAMEYLARRLEAGRLDEIDDVRGALAGTDTAEARLALWSRARAGTTEARWFGTIRAWAWEAFLCDPARGGNRGECGWRRFGYVGRPKAMRSGGTR